VYEVDDDACLTVPVDLASVVGWEAKEYTTSSGPGGEGNRPTKRRLPPELHCTDGIFHPLLSAGAVAAVACGRFRHAFCACGRITTATLYRCSGVSLADVPVRRFVRTE
jgi:hypothetical protein